VRASRQPVKAQEARAPHARLDFTRNPDEHVPPCTVNSPKARTKDGTLHLSFLSALRQSGRRGPPFTCLSSLEPFPQPRDNLTSSGLKSACGFVHFRILVHASLCPPLYKPTRTVSSSRRDQTEDATLRSSRVSCVPGQPHTSANARHRPLGPDDAKARAAAHTNGEGDPQLRSK